SHVHKEGRRAHHSIAEDVHLTIIVEIRKQSSGHRHRHHPACSTERREVEERAILVVHEHRGRIHSFSAIQISARYKQVFPSVVVEVIEPASPGNCWHSAIPCSRVWNGRASHMGSTRRIPLHLCEDVVCSLLHQDVVVPV